MPMLRGILQNHVGRKAIAIIILLKMFIKVQAKIFN